MSIWVDEEQKIFHLQSKDTSYIMRVVKGQPFLPESAKVMPVVRR